MSKKLNLAIELATDIHKNQVRKGPNKLPYVTHLFSVMATVGENGGSEDQMIGALFHDAIEDQSDNISILEIEEKFGTDVAKIVLDCTDDREIKDWQKRKEHHIEMMGIILEESKLVIIADKLHNLKCCANDVYNYTGESEEWWRQTFNRSKADMEWYFNALYSVFLDSSEFNKNLENEYRMYLNFLFN